MIDFSQFLVMPAMISLLLPHTSGITKVPEVWGALPRCSLKSSNLLSTCYDHGIGEFAQNQIKGKIRITKEDGTEVKDLIELEEGELISLWVNLERRSSGQVSMSFKTDREEGITFSTPGSNDFNSTLDLTFDSGRSDAKQEIIIKATDNKIDKENEKVIISFTPSGGGFTVNDKKQINASIKNDDLKGLNVEYEAKKLNFSGRLMKDEFACFKLRLKEINIDKIKKVKFDKSNIKIYKLESPCTPSLKSSEDKPKDVQVAEFENSNLSEDQIFMITLDTTNDSDKNESINFTLSLSHENDDDAELIVTSDFYFSKQNVSNSNLHEKIIDIKPHLAIEEGAQKKLRVKLNTEPESQVNVKISDTDGVIDIKDSFLKFNRDNWSGYQEIILSSEENDEDENDKRSNIVLELSGGNYDNYLSLMSVMSIDNDSPDAPTILAFAAAAAAVVIGLKSIPPILKLTSYADNNWSDVIEVAYNVRQFFQERANQEDLEGKLDEINARLDSIETKIDEKNS